MEKFLETTKNEVLEDVLKAKVDAISGYLELGMMKCAKIEARALKSFINYTIAEAKKNQKRETLIDIEDDEEEENESN